MDLVAVIFVLGIVADRSNPAEAEWLTGLLTDGNALIEGSGAVAFCKFVRIRIGLDGGLVVLRTANGKILDIIGIDIIRLGAVRRVRNRAQAVPGDTGGIHAVFLEIKNTILGTGFIKPFADGIPCKFTHVSCPP